MFAVLIDRRRHSFKTIKEAYDFFEKTNGDASLLNVSNHVYRIRRNGVVFWDGCYVRIKEEYADYPIEVFEKYEIVEIDDMKNTAEIRLPMSSYSFPVGLEMIQPI